jgi:hypothetical protein
MELERERLESTHERRDLVDKLRVDPVGRGKREEDRDVRRNPDRRSVPAGRLPPFLEDRTRFRHGDHERAAEIAHVRSNA